MMKFGVLLALIIYSIVLTYIFLVSPGLVEIYHEEWIKAELSKKPKYVENKICKECHLKEYKKLSEGEHSSLACMSCHEAFEHVKLRTAESVRTDDSRNVCLVCHLEVPGRKAISTVDDFHYPGVKCIVCHDPHTP